MKPVLNKKVMFFVAPSLFLFFLIILIMTALTPFMLLGADELEKYRYQENPSYAGAEYGVGNIKLTGTGVFTWPVPGRFNIVSGFGNRYHPILNVRKFHAGIDISANSGESVVAADGGTVTFAGWQNGYGNIVILSHGDILETRYGHNSKLLVKSGQQVTKGQTIALIGSTGLSTGPHLHFEVRLSGMPEDPAKYIGFTADVPDVLPEELQFKEVDPVKIIQWLNKYDSYLADSKYVEPIINAGKFNNVNPLLLVAITGQEQSFVPRSNSNADKIARNPFNVYHSWKEYSPGIEKSAMIAAKTVVNLSKDRPEGMNPLKWINSPSNPRGLYAEHQGWWIGVSKFFDLLREQVGYKE